MGGAATLQQTFAANVCSTQTVVPVVPVVLGWLVPVVRVATAAAAGRAFARFLCYARHALVEFPLGRRVAPKPSEPFSLL